MPTPKLLAFSGSLRVESFNQKMVNIAAQGAREAGAERAADPVDRVLQRARHGAVVLR